MNSDAFWDTTGPAATKIKLSNHDYTSFKHSDSNFFAHSVCN